MNPHGNDPSGRDPPNAFTGPNARQQQQYQFSADELRVFRECNKESFYQRCLPISTLLGLSTYYGVKAGYLRPSMNFGPTPKVIVSVIIGYFIGKISYQTKCAEKLMQLPNSRVGEILRQRRRGNMAETMDPNFGPGLSLAPFSNVSPGDTYTDLDPPRNNLDLDTSRPDQHGLDDTYRPSLDNPIYEEEMPPVQKHTTTYDELRKKNREEYQSKRMGNYREPIKSATVPPPVYSQPQTGSETRPEFIPSGPTGQKNKYGDVWE